MSLRGLDPEVVDLIVRLAGENPRWGYLRIKGECATLGVVVSATSVRNILRRHGLGPARRSGPTRMEFLRDQAAGIIACDFFTVETVGLHRLYVAVLHRTRAPPGVAVRSQRPPGQQLGYPAGRNLAMTLAEQNASFKFLIRDRDTRFTKGFDAVFAANGVRIV